MAGPGRLFAGGFASVVSGTRTRVLDREIGHPGVDVLLEQLAVHLALPAGPATTLIELLHNGRVLTAETHPISSHARYLSLPFIRVEGLGRLEVFLTQSVATVGGAANVTGRYVHTGTFPFEG